MKVRRVGAVRCTVGEGPLWDVAEQALYFVDLVEAKLWRHDPATASFAQWQLPSMTGSIALRASGGAIVALQDGFYAFDFASAVATPLCDPQPAGKLTQFNDGQVDRSGRFVAGTQPRALEDQRPLGRLFALEADLRTRELDQGYRITNGPCWSPDGTTFYVADSIARLIYAYDYDLASGGVCNRRTFASTQAYGGFPDGATVDADGNVWVSVCLGGKIVCFGSDGRERQVVDTPVATVSSVMFGGRGLDELYFTSINRALMIKAPHAWR